MFWINSYTYVDVNTHNKVVIFSRTLKFADSLVERINKLGTFTLKKNRLVFLTRMETDLPPYSIELEQAQTISNYEERKSSNK